MHQFLDKKQITRRKKIIRNIIGFGVFFILVAFGILSWTGQLFNSAGGPIWKTENFLTKSFYNLNYLFRTKSTITNENHNLIDEVTYLRTSMSDYQILKNENDELKELLGRVGETSNFVLGNILAKPNHSPYDTIIIDVGNNSGIIEGQIVYADGNVPIGSVEKVYDKTSLISLYTNPSRKTEGFIDISNVSVELIGRGGGNFEMVVPVELSLEKGTIIYLPGSNSKIIALVDEVISEPTDPFKRVLLSSPVNVQNLKWVQVLKE
jgi:cell shape-determining protein MreC